MPGLDHSALIELQLHSPFHYEQEGDPGAVGAFKWWYKPSTKVLKRRNTGDTDWDVVLDPSTLPTAVSWKASVRAATTAAVTLATGLENGDTIDGVALVTGDRILVKDQAAGAENGIYIVGASGAPVRASDADSAAELLGAAVVVRQGTANADTGWLATPDAITLETTAITWTKVFPIAAGMTDPLTTRGDIIYRGAAAPARRAVGTVGQVLKVVDIGAGVLEPDWAAEAGGSALTIEEVDGAPTGTPDTLKFPNGTLTDNGDGSFTYTDAGGGGGAPTTTPYVTTAADGGLSAEKVLPHLANYNPDIPPASPSAYDDEFDDDSIAGAYTSVGPPATLSETDYHGYLRMKHAVNAEVGVRKSFTPGAGVAFTVVAKMQATLPSDFAYFGIALQTAAAAGLAICTLQRESTTAKHIRTRHKFDGSANTSLGGGFDNPGPWYLMISRDTGTNYSTRISRDGKNWLSLLTESVAGTVDRILLIFSPLGTGEMAVTVDFLRTFASQTEIIGRAP